MFQMKWRGPLQKREKPVPLEMEGLSVTEYHIFLYSQIIRADMRLVFLGTGGSFPTKDRNVGSLALQSGGSVYLFDCGEGMRC